MMNSKTLTPLIFLAVAGIIFFGGVWQQLGVVQTLTSQVSKANAALKQAQGGNAEQNKLVDAWQNLDSELKDRVDLGVPAQSDLPNLILLLNNTVTASGLLTENIGIVETAQSSPTQTTSSVASGTSAAKLEQSVLLTVSARGDYPSIKAFVESIQREERIMDVQSVGISPFVTQGAQPSKIFEMIATVKAYYGQ